MYGLRIEHSGSNTYLVQRIGKDDRLDTLSLGMITHNVIQGVVPVRCIQEKEEKYLKYDISHKETAKNIFMAQGYDSKPPKRLLDVFLEVSSTFLRAEDYMIDLSLFLLELDYIYVDVSTDEISLMCIPMTSHGRSPMGLAAFFMDMTTHIQLTRTEKDSCIRTIVNYLKDAAAFSLEGFHSILESLKQEFSRQAVWKNEFANHPFESSPPVSVEADTQESRGILAPQQPISCEADQILHSDEAPKLPDNGESRPPAGSPEQLPGLHPEPQIHDEAGKIGEFPISPMDNRGSGHVVWTRVPLNQSAPELPVVPMAQSWGQAEFFAVPGTPAWNQPELPVVPMSQKQSGPEPAAVLGAPWNQPGPSSAPIPQNRSWSQSKSQLDSSMMPQSQGQPESPAVPMPQSQGQREPPVSQRFQSYGQTEFSAIPAPQSQPGLSAPAVPGPSQTQDEAISSKGESSEFPFIIRRRTKQKLIINKSVFKIGKAKNDVDCYIGDNKAISRNHANIITSDGHYYIVDMGSTNHTYVDGCKVQSHVMKEIFHGAVLKFADEEFDFMRHA